jgi:hypothetical protein
MCDSNHNKGIVRTFISNLKSPLPLKKKIKLLIKNTWTKIYTRKACCGHPGEPGC